MSDIIQLLPDHIANQIAAGEVIQRPSSAVKELVENAIDANATQIQLIIKSAGKVLIQIIDNGKGMSATDARRCFEKHATSKIKKIDELFSLRTKGFRGEALASIAAVAQVELKTRQEHDELGTKILIEDSEVKSQEPCQTPVGTSISMKNIFYNVPARRNFLKGDSVEMRHIIDEFERLALAHTDVFFSLIHNDTEIYHLPIGNLRQRITQIFGKNYDQRLVPVNEKSDIIHIHGFIGKPDYTKKTRGEQLLFVNQRFIKNAYINHAIMTGFEGLIAKDEYPLYVLFIDIDPASIDINVHPSKQEIKFEDDRLVYSFVNAGVRHALAQYNLTPSLDFNQDNTLNSFDSFIKPIFNQNQKDQIIASNQSSINYNRPMVGVVQKNASNWEELFKQENEEIKRNESVTISPLWDEKKKSEDHEESIAHAPYQIHSKYIVSPIKSGFILIDQSTAHERILYDKYSAFFESAKNATQKLLFPINLHLTASDASLLHDLLPEIAIIGFEMEHFGQNDFIIHGIPADFAPGHEIKIIEEVLEQYKINASTEQISPRENISKSMAWSNSIKWGKKLSIPEMQTLIEDLFASSNPYYGPRGNKTFTKFDLEEIDRRFV